MICSMTAFARREHRDDHGELVWELRSVNHRYLEAVVRLPEEFRALEPLVRESLGKRLGRGKLDCTLRFKPAHAAVARLEVNGRLAAQLMEAADTIGHILHEAVPPSAMDILRWPGVLESEAPDMTPVQEQATALLEATIETLIECRRREGERLAELILQRVDALREQVAQAKQCMPRVLEGTRNRLRARLEEVSTELNVERLEQEMVLLAQRLDVDEEMDRLGTHLDEVARVVRAGGAVGRRLDFLMQELNREANTLSSKSNDVETTRIGVEMKVLIEQMREQVQNIE